jgi:hypothetical protein
MPSIVSLPHGIKPPRKYHFADVAEWMGRLESLRAKPDLPDYACVRLACAALVMKTADRDPRARKLPPIEDGIHHPMPNVTYIDDYIEAQEMVQTIEARLGKRPVGGAQPSAAAKWVWSKGDGANGVI